MKTQKQVSETIIEILRKRCGLETHIVFDDDSVIKVFNIAWGFHRGDDNAHFTTNISPEVEESQIHYFEADEVMEIRDGGSEKRIWSRG